VLPASLQREFSAAAPLTHAARFYADQASSDASGREAASHESFSEGLHSAELLFPDITEECHHHQHSGDATSSRFSGESTQRTTPQPEPTSESARAVAQRRRRLFARCTDLHRVIEEELHAEVARDVKDGVAAVPPLAPTGWRVLHQTGSSYFTMTRVERGGGDAAGRASSAFTDCPSSVPRYRSVHDMMTGRSDKRAPPSRSHGDRTPPAQDRHRVHILGDSSSGGRRGVRYLRSDTHITLFAPFRTLDLTLYNPKVDICEWTRFDVLVRKSKPAATTPRSTSPSSSVHQQKGQPSPTLLEGQQEIWDEGRCMFLRLACANGELRIRSVQFVSDTLACALEEHAVFGRGEPLYLELLRRQRREGAVVGRAHADGRRWHTAVSSLNVFDAPASNTAAASSPTESAAEGASTDAASVLTSQFNRSGEYARTFAYGGPYLTELSKELREALQEYVMLNLGITSEVAEYVCQMQFFLEQEEYVGWLAQWGQLASTLRQTL
jgi:hypothetical protein